MRRTHHVFQKLIDSAASKAPVTTAVCHPCTEISLLGAVEAAQQHLIEPILVGPPRKLHATADLAHVDIAPYRLVATEHSHDSAARAVELCRRGKCEALMKGSLHTDELMHEVMQQATGLRTERRMSHVFVMAVPSYPRILFITDAAINIYPTLEDKVDIVQNAIDLAHLLHVRHPKVAILSAVEIVTPKITSTIDAAALCKMADRGQIIGGIVDGPLAFDNAISLKAATIKQIKSKVAGSADILVVPDLESGNMLAKQLEYLADAETAGVVLGARVPIILTSRSDSARVRLASSAIAVLVAHGRRHGLRKAVQA